MDIDTLLNFVNKKKSKKNTKHKNNYEIKSSKSNENSKKSSDLN